MLLRLQRYEFEVSYKKGPSLLMADPLSRVYLSLKEAPEDQENIMAVSETRLPTEIEAEQVNMLQYLLVKDETLCQIQNLTQEDAILKTLAGVIKQGWPESKLHLPPEVQDYFPFKEELTLQNGVIFKGDRAVIPFQMRTEIKRKLDSSHLEVQACQRRAREAFYWPGMYKEIEEYVSQCAVWNIYHQGQQREPMISHPVPSRPWQVLAVDLFELRGQDYLFTTDYYSNFFEVDKLVTKTSKEVIEKLKIVRSTIENSTLRACLSYDSTLNYFLWSSNVASLKILVSEILKNTAIASAEVNEDKHHKMLSFKAADCTIKLYTTTKKIIIQGSGSASLTKAFSDFLNDKDNGDEAMNSNNGGQQSEASAADEHIETYAIEQLDPTDALTTTSQDEVKSDLQLIKEEIKRMKNDISYILNNGGKINISSASAAETENLNFRLQEENILLCYQLKVAKDNLAELKEVIGTIEREKSTLISTIRILQQNDLKLSQEEAYNFTAVGTTTEAVKSSEAVTQTSISVMRPAKNTKQNGKKNQSQKKNQKDSGDRKDKKKEQEHGLQNILLESSNSWPGTSFNRQSEQQDSENWVVILGDSTVKE